MTKNQRIALSSYVVRLASIRDLLISIRDQLDVCSFERCHLEDSVSCLSDAIDYLLGSLE